MQASEGQQPPAQLPAHAGVSVKADASYKWNVLAQFLCQHFGVRDVSQVTPIPTNKVEAWQLMNESTVGVRFAADSVMWDYDKSAEDQVITVTVGASEMTGQAQPKKQFLHPVTKQGMPSDLSRVAIYSITCRSYSNGTGVEVAPRLNYYHGSMNEAQKTEAIDGIYSAAGAAVRGSFGTLPPTAPGEIGDIKMIPMAELGFGYQSRALIQTFAYVTEENIRNGLVSIPPEVCAAAGLPIWRGPEAIDVGEDFLLQQLRSLKIDPNSEKGQETKENLAAEARENFIRENKELIENPNNLVAFYYLVPVMHILAWPYHSEDLTKEAGHRAMQFRFLPPQGKEPILLYYIVPNNLIEQTIEGMKVTYFGKVDKRPLGQVGVEFLPKFGQEGGGGVVGDISLQTYISYFSGPRLGAETIRNLMPTLAPGYAPSWHWSRKAVEREAIYNAL